MSIEAWIRKIEWQRAVACRLQSNRAATAGHTRLIALRAIFQTQSALLHYAMLPCACCAHLELDVARVLHVTLQVHVAVAKGGLRLLLRLLQQRQELALVLHRQGIARVVC